MLIVGAKGFAKELLDVFFTLGQTENIVFFDNVSKEVPDLLFNQFLVLKTKEEVKSNFFHQDNHFVLGLGNPHFRSQMTLLFESWGGILTSIISPAANIGNFDVTIGAGATILAQSTISNTTYIGKGLLMYSNAIITHDCVLGDFVELSPGATLLGHCYIGAHSHIGANATVLTHVKV